MLIYCNQKLDSRKTKKTHNQANKQTKKNKQANKNKQQKQQTNKQQTSKQTKTKQITKTNKQQTNKQANKNNKNKQTTNKQANKNNKNKQTNNKQTKNKTIEVGPQFLNLYFVTRHFLLTVHPPKDYSSAPSSWVLCSQLVTASVAAAPTALSSLTW